MFSFDNAVNNLYDFALSTISDKGYEEMKEYVKQNNPPEYDAIIKEVEARTFANYSKENDQALTAIRKLSLPLMNGKSETKISGGYSVKMSHSKAGYGRGGVIETSIVDRDGKESYNWRTRYGDNGMATFENKSEALRSIKRELNSGY